MKKVLSLLLFAFLLSGCAAGLDYAKLDNLMKADDCTGASEYIKKSGKKTYGKNAKLLYLVDLAMINLKCGNYESAAHNFQEAEDLANDLWTQSVSKGAASFIVNDTVIPYSGEDFERALINLFAAFSYLKMNQYDEAMVECRKLDLLLGEYNKKYEKKKNAYKEDAFARYLSGIMNEADGEIDAAYIDYYKALKTFKDYNINYGTPTPSYLLEDLLRVAEAEDRMDEVRKLIPNYRKFKWIKQRNARRMGKIVFIHYNGKAPKKISEQIVINDPTAGPISIAFPKYTVSSPACSSSQMIVESETESVTRKALLFEDINKIALRTLDDRKARIWAKTIARAIAKQIAINATAKAVEDQAGGVWGAVTKIGMNVANTAALEKADTRTWRTLPGEIYLARAYVPAGSYTVSVEQCAGYKKSLKTVTVKPGQTQFVFYDSIY